MNLYWSGPLEGHIRNFHFRGVGGGWGGGGGGGGGGALASPHGGMSSISQYCQSEAPFNFMLVLTIKGDILGTFGALHV